MARPGITYNDVKRAADEIDGDGINPTIDRVRAILGTGNRGTIATHLKRWKTEHGQTAALVNLHGLPTELALGLRNLVDQAEAQAARQVAELEGTYRVDAARQAAQVDALTKEHAALIDAHARQSTALTEARATIERLQSDVQQRAAALSDSTHAQRALEQRLHDRDGEVDRLVAELKQHRDQFERYQEAAARSRQEDRQAAEARANQLEHALAAAHTALRDKDSAIAAERGAWSAERGGLLAQLRDSHATETSTRAALADTNARLEGMSRQLTATTESLEALAEEHRRVQALLAAGETRRAVLEATVTGLHETIGRLEKAIPRTVAPAGGGDPPQKPPPDKR
ncbi:MAG: DNA-binding protein [Gammaproteobacteria bacterium]|nr:DNA-binding protein [Gammaproteobacteria bacterium]